MEHKDPGKIMHHSSFHWRHKNIRFLKRDEEAVTTLTLIHETNRDAKLHPILHVVFVRLDWNCAYVVVQFIKSTKPQSLAWQSSCLTPPPSPSSWYDSQLIYRCCEHYITHPVNLSIWFAWHTNMSMSLFCRNGAVQLAPLTVYHDE